MDKLVVNTEVDEEFVAVLERKKTYKIKLTEKWTAKPANKQASKQWSNKPAFSPVLHNKIWQFHEDKM